MLKARAVLLAAMLGQIALAEAHAEPLTCYTQFGDVRFTKADNTLVLLPYNQCLHYVGRDGIYIRARAGLRGLNPAEGWIFVGDVRCGPGSCARR